MRDAGRVPHLSVAEQQLLSVVVGGFLAIAGGLVVARRRAADSRAESHERAVNEANAAAGDLLAGVRLFRVVRGQRTRSRYLASGFRHGMKIERAGPETGILSFWERAAASFLGAFADTLPELAEGGVFDQITEGNAAHYQVTVLPVQQRLTAAVAVLDSGVDRALAEAADRLVKAGGALADGASSSSRVFKRAERKFERCRQEFRDAAAASRRRPRFGRRRR
jgi:flavin-binding protein dodecin